MATELGKAYVQIMPSAKGISGSISKQIEPESASAGKSAGGKIVGAIKGVIAVAAIGKAISASLSEGADLQQSLGGIETLFKDNADKVKKHAEEAYKTTGLSANAYMESVTSFSASLLQSLGGDTDKAAEKSNMAMIDMSDNANKMGSSMESIQNAYQGFAKQNYTMLDNLKLGYGGTKTEMERLLADAEKLTGVKYDISNLGDVYDAINAVQGELGITGTTALESAETFSGSMASMKASFSNFLGNLSLGQDVTPSLNALAKTTSTFLFGNLLPMIGNIVKAIPSIVVTSVQELTPRLIEEGGKLITSLTSGVTGSLPTFITGLQSMITNVMAYITENLPMFLEKGTEIITSLANGILQAIPQLVESAWSVATNFVSFILDNLPAIMESGKNLIMSLVDGIIKNLPAMADSAIKGVNNFLSAIKEKLPGVLQKGKETILSLVNGIINNLPALAESAIKVVVGFVVALAKNLPSIIKTGKEFIISLALGLIKAIPNLVGKLPQIISAIVKGLLSGVGSLAGVGLDLVKGLWNGIKDATGWIMDKIKGFGESILKGIKGIFGIHSPSTVFRDEIGKNLALGLGEGFTGEMKSITRDMNNSLPTDFEVSSTFSAMSTKGNNELNIPKEQMSININIASVDINNDMDIEQFASELGFLIKRNLIGGGRIDYSLV